jgi:transglutaminase-like putative cysteine protease
MVAMNAAFATDDGNDTSITIEKDIRHHVINADGSFIATNDLVILINEERAINGYAQRYLSYNRTLESLEVVEAFTQKPDGRKVLVRPDQIKELQERESSDAPMFQDSLVKVVIFPEVAVGDRLVIQFKTYRNTALFPQHFESLSHPAFHPTEQYTLVYDLPQSMPLYADARGFTASDPVVAAGRKIYRWDNIPDKKDRIENGSVSYQDYGQYLAVSTFPDFKAFAQAYDARARSRVTAEVSQLAKTITANLVSPREKAIALNDWVRKNIRYVAVYVGAGGVVPHPVGTILANRYGDCKDHVALLEALLAAVDIESTPALINSDNAYSLPKVPTLGVLNHAINYIPSLDLYLDTTAQEIAGGYLPVYNLDKPVVFSKSGTLGRTPATQEGKVENTTVFLVDSNGDVDFTHYSRITGWSAEVNRFLVNLMSSADRDMLVQKILTVWGQTGKGAFIVKQHELNENEFSMSMTGRSVKLVGFPGPTSISTTTSFGGGISQNIFAFAAENDRAQAFTCISGLTEESARFEFSEGVKIIAVPENVALDYPKIQYKAEYSKEPNAVIVRRVFKFDNESASCSAEEFKGMAPVIDVMVRDIRSQIIVEIEK